MSQWVNGSFGWLAMHMTCFQCFAIPVSNLKQGTKLCQRLGLHFCASAHWWSGVCLSGWHVQFQSNGDSNVCKWFDNVGFERGNGQSSTIIFHLQTFCIHLLSSCSLVTMSFVGVLVVFLCPFSIAKQEFEMQSKFFKMKDLMYQICFSHGTSINLGNDSSEIEQSDASSCSQTGETTNHIRARSRRAEQFCPSSVWNFHQFAGHDSRLGCSWWRLLSSRK